MQKQLAEILGIFAQAIEDIDVYYFARNIYNQLDDIEMEPELREALIELHRTARNAVRDLDQFDIYKD